MAKSSRGFTFIFYITVAVANYLLKAPLHQPRSKEVGDD